MTSFNLAKKTQQERIETELSKQASHAIHQLRKGEKSHSDISQQIASVPEEHQQFFRNELNRYRSQKG